MILNFTSYGSDNYRLHTLLKHHCFDIASNSKYPNLYHLIHSDINCYTKRLRKHLHVNQVRVVHDPVINFSVNTIDNNQYTILTLTTGDLQKLSHDALNAGISHELYHVMTFQNSKANTYNTVLKAVQGLSAIGLATIPSLAIGTGLASLVSSASLSWLLKPSLLLGSALGSSSVIKHLIEYYNELKADQFSCRVTSKSALLELLYSIKRDYQKYGSMSKSQKFYDVHKSIQKRIDYFSKC